MNDNIDKNEIRKAIDRLQIEHPCNIAYDPIAFVNMEAVNTIKGCIDQIAKRMTEDTEINIICEFAKLYLEGVRPTVMRKQEWIPCSERLPEKDGRYIVCWCGDWGVDVRIAKYSQSGKYWFDSDGYEMREIYVWMPLPKPYRRGDPDV